MEKLLHYYYVQAKNYKECFVGCWKITFKDIQINFCEGKDKAKNAGL